MKNLFKSLFAASMIVTAAPVLAEKGTVDVLAPLDVAGVVYRIATDKAMIQGTAQGILYVQTKSGSLDAMLMRCATRNFVDLTVGGTDASGYCLISDGSKENLIFAEMSCKGKAPAACSGDFKINGGTGKYEGATGAGKLGIRAALSAVAANVETGAVVKETKGLAVITKLKYSIPGK
jgi:hypothetical protein